MAKLNSETYRHLAIAALPLATVCYALWYWASSRAELADWYTRLCPFFYKAETWRSAVFAPEVKSHGNAWCAAALAAAVAWAWSVSGKWPRAERPFHPDRQRLIVWGTVALAAVGLSLLAQHRVRCAADEVFSAVNFAALPPFQTLSHYPLPNNHILFNLLNGTLSFGCGDLVLTGRLLSMLCYAAVLAASWEFLKKHTQSAWLSTAALAAVAVQFPVWGFSGQARGYELLLLCSWGSIATFLAYWSEQKPSALRLHALCNVAGMLTVPSYLYWWGGLGLAALVLMLRAHRWDRLYLRASLAGASATLICYLPVLTFSGAAALADNRYVRPGTGGPWYFLAHLNEQGYFNGLFSEWFGWPASGPLMGAVCVLLPVLLLFFLKNTAPRRTLGISYLALLAAFLLAAVLMRRFPFYRNLIAQGHLAVLLGVVAVAPLFRSRVARSAFGAALLAWAGWSAFRNYERMPGSLYYYPVNEYAEQAAQCKVAFEPQRTVFLDNECFYWDCVLRTRYAGLHLRIAHNRPAFDGQDYCIMPADSLPPASAGVRYRKLERCGGEDVFEREE
ncbi:MAG: hypothetical protein ACKVUS_15505 [Saprospiraceae bacterium]